jgi:hypothetical protein
MNDESDSFLVDYEDPDLRAKAARLRRREKVRFIMVPLTWKSRLAKAKHAATLKLALHLLFETWRRKDAKVALSNARMAEDGISRWQKWRALGELEQLGLVRIERRKRKSPVATVVKV